MYKIKPSYGVYNPPLPNVIIIEKFGKHSITYYAHKLNHIGKRLIRAEDIYIIKKDLKGKLPFRSIKLLHLRMDTSCEVFLLSDDEALEIQTLIAFNTLFLKE